MVLFTYLKELAIRGYFIGVSVVLSFSIVFLYREEFVLLFATPYWDSIRGGSFIYTGMSEVFQTYLGLSVVISLYVFLLMICINLYLFLLPAMFLWERTKLNKKLIILSSLLLSSVCVIHQYIVKGICQYLTGYSELKGNSGLEFNFEPRVLEFVKFVVRLDLLFSLIFLGLICYFIYMWSINSNLLVEHIKKQRQGVYFSFILTIILVLPADFLLHLLVFGILICCYEGVIILLLLFKNYEFAWWNW